MPPAVSVILPTHNRADLLAEAIASVRSQTWEDWELLVVDDGSTDGSSDRLPGDETRLRYLRRERGGVSRARNHGLDRARGEFIAFLDSDDLWAPDKLRLQMEAFRREPRLGAVCCDMVETDAGGERPESFFQRIGFAGPLTPEKMFFRNPVATPTLVARRSVVEAAGPFDADLSGAEDYEFAFRLLREAPVRPQFRCLVRRRLQPGRLSGDRLQMARGTLQALERALEWFPEIRRTPAAGVNRRFAGLQVDLAYALLLEDDFPAARRALVRSLRGAPATGRAWYFLAVSLLGPRGFRRLRRLRRPAPSAAHPGSGT